MPFVAGVTGGPEAGKWHHLALTYDKASNTRSIYVDGILSNSENNDPAINTWGVAMMTQLLFQLLLETRTKLTVLVMMA